MSLTIKIRYFASIREAIGKSEERMQVVNPTTLTELRGQLIDLGGGYAEALARDKTVRCAVNQEMVQGEVKGLTHGCEVAFFPPVTGG
jgi:sulfur-carrier protein